MTRSVLGQISHREIRLLKIFQTVTDAGGISAAELELNIGRSTISRHIKDLEIRLGVTLCHRGRGGFSLTHNGKIVYEESLKLMGALTSFHSKINDIHSSMTGQISLALFDKTLSNRECKLNKALEFFDDIAPKVSLNIHVEALNEIENGVLEGRYQVGIIPTHRASTSLSYQTLFYEPMELYGSSKHPVFDSNTNHISAAKIRKHRYAGLGFHSPNMEFSHKTGITRSATGYDQEAIAHLVFSGRYLGHLPKHYAQPFVEQNLIRPLENKTFQYCCEFVSIVRKSPKPSRILSIFLDCLSKAHTP